MSTQSRKARGMRTQLVVATSLRTLWPLADSTGAGRPGQDILNTPGYALEVKARRAFRPTEWLRQARHNAAGLRPAVIFRPDGLGECSIDEWGVLMTLKDWKELVSESEFGRPLDAA